MNTPASQPNRLARLMREAVSRCRIDLRGAVVLTEAASGPYVVTPVLAALAGADHVYAFTRASEYGSVEDVKAQTQGLCQVAGVGLHCVQVVTRKTRDVVAAADVVTNSGHVRPIDREMINWMKPTAVVSLMYEPWEMRPRDVDVEACRVRGIRVAGTNERHADVDVFSYLGVMAIKQLTDAGIAVHRSRIVVLCDNPFAPFLHTGLASAGARVEVVADLDDAVTEWADAVLVARREPPAAFDAQRWAGAVVVQFWGDIDRAALARAGLAFWPVAAPPPGHMGILPSAIGPEPVVRLQAGGLKVAEVLLRSRDGAVGGADRDYVREV
jgi:hypothetical protein